MKTHTKYLTLIYMLIIIVICVLFVPYQDINYSSRGNEIITTHSNLFNEGYGTMEILRLFVYFFVPAIFLYLINKIITK